MKYIHVLLISVNLIFILEAKYDNKYSHKIKIYQLSFKSKSKDIFKYLSC